jgi:hypothetical protein
MNNFNDSVELLVEEGIASFEFKRLSPYDYEQLMILSKKVSAQNPGFLYCTDHGIVPDNKTDRGIFRRERNEETKQDAKWLYQYRPSLRRELLAKLGNPKFLPNELEEWLQKAKQVHTTLHEFSKEIILGVNHLIPEHNLYKRYIDIESEDLHMSRNVAYDKSNGFVEVAEDHCDFSFITLAANQSYPGLWAEDKHGNMVERKPEEGKIFVFWGRKAPTASKGILRKIKHRVSVPKIGVQRDANIFFGHLFDAEME